jgi:hypothetical protein
MKTSYVKHTEDAKNKNLLFALVMQCPIWDKNTSKRQIFQY